jgi:ArsR family transcriptional regulator
MMDQHLRDEVAQLHAQMCSGLADTNRILIIYALAEHAMSVGMLAEMLNLSQTATSRHLKILREQGIVRAVREGQAVIYSIADNRVVMALDLLRAVMTDHLGNRMSLVMNQTN